MSTQEIFRLPDLGEGLTESEIVEWKVSVGDTVTLNQALAEVETAKAMVEIPSPFAGTVAALHAEEGDIVEVGEPLVTFGDGTGGDGAGDDAPAEASAEGVASAPEPAPESTAPEPTVPATTVEPAPAASATTSTAAERSASSASTNGSVEESSGANLVGYGTRAARKGKPTRRPRKPVDAPPAPVRNAGPAAAPAAARTAEHRVKVRSVRKHTAAAMVASARVPQATVHLTCDVTETLALVARLREHPRTRHTKVGLLTVIARAVCGLVPQHPAIVTRWEEKDGGQAELVRSPHVNLGIAVATDRGLVVPHIPHADELSMLGMARALRELATTARSGRTRPDRLTGGTMTLTNVGVFGVDAGSPLLNPGESAILGIGQVARRPWEHEGQIALRDVVTFSLTFDHRVVDGEQGARFLADLGGLLTDPALAVLLGGRDEPEQDEAEQDDGAAGRNGAASSRQAVTV
ncbi:dihydrolipoamide acetyltransferase family protein [Isoptericola sp. b515]|uniref:dihydrolipoamide acetyltransferase family protein n=1 Tax=Isoptericola sp. b515 TaxID=3064652 RepID=UPI00271280E7|nr:dihydrolipoamide acetyltransferase family protein [Isoptericola sp. b515]MDO8147161.1 dihydrolipoamide acetyltransferase family protein [Isoptericola sp. b515]